MTDLQRGPSEAAPARGGGSFVARAASVTAVVTALGALLGLLRDQSIASLFGAGAATDAFLVAWTVPEMAATLLIEDAMALVLVPAFSLALARRTADAQGPDAQVTDPVRAFVAATLPRLLLALAGASALLAAGAPWVVRLLAPGLADPRLAVDCTRLTALTVLAFGTAGYFSAALRAHRSFTLPAAIYCAYNAVIVATVHLAHGRWGVRAAAAGVALGGAAMVLMQLPSSWKRLTAGSRRGPVGGRLRTAARAALSGAGAPVAFGLVLPVALFTLTRQSQVLAERFLGSSLPAGAISHLNYAQKIAQLPMVLSMMICTVTFPLVARALADGQAERARRRVEKDLGWASAVVLLGTAYVIACAPQIVQLLFQRGAFDAADTAATAGVMRVYALGLLGHCLVGTLVRPYFSEARPTWYPLLCMAGGLALTVAAGLAAAPLWGVRGIAAANAAGITVTAVALLGGLGSGGRRSALVLDVRAVCLTVGRLAAAAAAATATGWAVVHALGGPALLLAVLGGLLVPAVFTAAAVALRAPEADVALHVLRTLPRKVRHDR